MGGGCDGWAVCRFKTGLGEKEGENFFSQFSLKCPLKYFVQRFVDKIPQKQLVTAVNCYCTYIFKGSNARFSGPLFRKYFKNSYLDTSINN